MVTRPCGALDSNIRGKTRRSGLNKAAAKCGGQSGCPGLDHPGRIKQQEPPPPGLDHPGTSGGQTPWTGSSGTEQAAGAAAPRTGSSGADQAVGAAAPQSGSSRDKWRADAPDRINRGRTRSNGHQPRGQDQPEKCGLPPRARLPGAHQAAGVPTPRAGASRGKWRPGAKETRGQGQGGAAMESCPEATQRTMPRRCSDTKMRTRPRRHCAPMMRTGQR